jgi:hypothetical protein
MNRKMEWLGPPRGAVADSPAREAEPADISAMR